MRFPNIAEVAAELRLLNYHIEGECDVRLQVYLDGQWAVRWGDSQYDWDHRGSWGCGTIPGSGKRFGSRRLAKDLIEQAREARAYQEAV
jgi:hypothetical protein